MPVKSWRLHGTFPTASFFAALAAVIFRVRDFWKIQQDDSYIFYSYADNIANGYGYVFNMGEKINATTSPLYTILLSFIHKIFHFIALPIAGHLIGGVSLFLIAFLLMNSFEDASFSPVPFVLPLVFLMNPLLVNAAGMETFLAMMFGMLSLYFYVRGKLSAASLSLSFAVLGRPDMILLALVLLIYDVLRKRRLPTLRMSGAFLLPILMWVLFSLRYFGSALPTTLAAKLGQTESGRWGTGLLFLKGFFLPSLWGGSVSLLLMAVLVMLGIAAAVLRFRQWSLFRQPILHLILLWSLVYFFVYGFILNPPAYPWYYTPLALGISAVISLLSEAIYRLRQKAGTAAKGIFFIAAAGLGVAAAGAALPLKADFFSPLTEKYEIYKLAAEWLNAHASPGASVGANEIGVIRFYYKKGPIIDALGLVTPGVAQHVRRRDYSWYIHEYKPDFLMFNYPHRAVLEDMADAGWFKELYLPVKRIRVKNRSVAIYARMGNNHSL